MANIVISNVDLERADKFLSAYLTANVSEADFSEGGAVRDFTVKAIAYVFAYLEKERESIRNRQSFLRLKELPPEDVDDAMAELMSNWFITPKGGQKTQLPTVLHFSATVDVVIPAQTAFDRVSGVTFYPDTVDNVVIAASDMRPNYDASGAVVDYVATITLVATEAGVLYNAPPGRFVRVDTFSPYFLYAENVTEGLDGKDKETIDEVLARAPQEISVRNLVNERSITAVLKDVYADQVAVIGMGDPEMLRDVSPISVGNRKLHTGGYTDIYVGLPRTEVTETLTIGAQFARPDGVVSVLRDAAADFSAVQPGHVLHITAGLPNVPLDYLIFSKNAASHELVVFERTPFSSATDEATPATNVTYSVGTTSPNFSNVVTSRATGQTSRKVATAGQVLLQGQPIYRVKTVDVYDSGTQTATAPLTRINSGAPTATEYLVSVAVPANAQSSLSLTTITVNVTHNTKTLRVTYETLSGYSAVQTFVSSRKDRVSAKNMLVKGFHPVYLGLAFTFSRKSTATGAVDPALVQQAIVDFVNNFDYSNTISLSAINASIQAEFPDIGTIFPTPLSYTLYAPDGQVFQFQTKDVVSIFPSYPGNLVQLTNAASVNVTGVLNLALDPTQPGNDTLFNADAVNLRTHFEGLGISDRVIRYMSSLADVTVTER